MLWIAIKTNTPAFRAHGLGDLVAGIELARLLREVADDPHLGRPDYRRTLLDINGVAVGIALMVADDELRDKRTSADFAQADG